MDMQVISIVAEERSGQTSLWVTDKPGKNEQGKQFPNVSGTVVLSPWMLNQIVKHGEFTSEEVVHLSIGAYENTKHEGNQPTHRGKVSFKQMKQSTAKKAVEL